MVANCVPIGSAIADELEGDLLSLPGRQVGLEVAPFVFDDVLFGDDVLFLVLVDHTYFKEDTVADIG